MSIKQKIKKLLYAINEKADVVVKYSTIHLIKINSEYEKYTSEFEVMKRLMEVYERGY